MKYKKAHLITSGGGAGDCGGGGIVVCGGGGAGDFGDGGISGGQWFDERELYKQQRDKLLTALRHAVEIAEDKRPGTWDDLLEYRAIIAEVEAAK